MAKIKAAVIFGGTSREHKLSLASAAEVIRNIPKDKYELTCIGITRKGRWLYFPGDVEDIPRGEWDLDPDCTSPIISPDPLNRGLIVIENGEAVVRRLDVVFPVVMGKHGADGTIQGLLDLSGIPYVGSGVLAAASCMDKSHIHMVMDDHGIDTAEWRIITQSELNDIDGRCEEIAGELGFPLIVKPARLGSSIGISVVLKPHIWSRNLPIFDMNTACIITIKNINVQSYRITRKFITDKSIVCLIGRPLHL